MSKLLLLLAALILMAGMHAYFENVIIPAQELDAIAHNKTRGNQSDLYARWLGAQELLLHGRDPYGPEVTAKIQEGYLGRLVNHQDPDNPVDEVRFAYPLYVVFLLAPTVTMPFHYVQVFYMWFAAACTVASVWLWFHAFGYRGSQLTKIIASLLLLGSYPVVQALHLQQPALIVAALAAVAIAATASGMYWAAGIAMALAMIKPQTAGPIAAWLLFWSVSNWRERKSFLFGFATTMALLFAGSEWLLPGWLFEWRDATAAYMRYTAGVPAHVQLLFGRYLGGAVAVLLVLGIGLFCWSARRDAASTDRFKLAPALIFAVSLAVSPIWHEYDLMFLLPVALLAFHWRDAFGRLKPFQRAIVSVSAAGLGWQWIAAAALSAIAIASPALARNLEILPWLSVFFGPTLGLALLLLIARVRLWV